MSPVQAASISKWMWWSTDRKYWHELGFVAGFAQLCGATIFWISGFTGISEIISVLQRDRGALVGAFWVPQVVGGTGFIISSYVSSILAIRHCNIVSAPLYRTLYMLEAQKKWYIPAFTRLGWHVGCEYPPLIISLVSPFSHLPFTVWNFIGAMGFTLSGAFGLSNNHGLKYQSALSTFWGSK